MDFLNSNNRAHFIAIGGSIMHSLAISLRNIGLKVTGSDDEIFEPALSRLRNAGLLPEKNGWFPDKIDESVDFVVLGMHAKKDNPELKKALEKKIKIYSFPELLYAFSEQKTRIVIAGSHGKTTITSMLMHAFKANGKSFDYAVGGSLEGFEQMVSLSTDKPYMLIEGDEYLSSPLDSRSKFLHYQPHHVLISGIAWDHINVFPEFEQYLKAFSDLIQSTDKKGSLSYDETDQQLNQLVSESAPDLKLFPYRLPSYQIAENGEATVQILGLQVKTDIPGKHNYLNMQGAANVWEALGFPVADFAKAMQTFKLPGLRLQYWKRTDKKAVIRDFAHAPSKVFASVNAIREHYSSHAFTAVLELHTYSSLNPDFIKYYTDVFKQTEHAAVFLDKKALEIKGKTMPEADFLKKAFNHDKLEVITDAQALKSYLYSISEEKTVILLMSSGKLGGLTETDFK